MTKLILGAFLFFSSMSFGQIISGEIVDEGRKMISETSFVVEGMADGFAIYEVAVNRNGKVTSAKLVESNLKNTPAKYEIRNYITRIKFAPGTIYPKFHHAKVKITTVKQK